MSRRHITQRALRTRWSAVGAAIAISLGAGGLGLAEAGVQSGDRPVVVTITPTRVLDTRVGLGLVGPLVDSSPRELRVTGQIPVAPSGKAVVVPADATAVVTNVTVVRPTHSGWFAIRPGGATGEPTTSTVNFKAGSTEPNAATADLGPGGTVQLWLETPFQTGEAHVLLDIVGYTIDHAHDDRYYTEAESDAALAAKADVLSVYTKAQSDARYYTQAEVDLMIGALHDARSFALSDVAGQNIDMTLMTQTIAAVEVTAPVDGQVTVNSSAYPVADAGTTISCYVTDGATMTMPQWFQPAAGVSNGNLSGTGTFDLAAGQTGTYEYQCWSPDAGGFVDSTSGLTAIFTPAP